MIKIEKSICGGFVRITIAGMSHVFTIADWSRALAPVGEFMVTPAEKLAAQARRP